jgi:hypothetical protein
VLLSSTAEISLEALNRSSNARSKSSWRMVWPACFEAQVAKLHQLAEKPMSAAMHGEIS